jgi:hypothetical protein
MTENDAATLPIVAVPRLSFGSLRELRRLIEAHRICSLPSSEPTRTDAGKPEESLAKKSRPQVVKQKLEYRRRISTEDVPF